MFVSRLTNTSFKLKELSLKLASLFPSIDIFTASTSFSSVKVFTIEYTVLLSASAPPLWFSINSFDKSTFTIPFLVSILFIFVPSGITFSNPSFFGPSISSFNNVLYGSFVNSFTSTLLASGTNVFVSFWLKYRDTIVCLNPTTSISSSGMYSIISFFPLFSFVFVYTPHPY